MNVYKPTGEYRKYCLNIVLKKTKFSTRRQFTTAVRLIQEHELLPKLVKLLEKKYQKIVSSKKFSF